MSQVFTLLGKEITLFLKDKTAILLTFLVPFFVIYIVGNIFSGSGDGGGGLSSKIKLAVYDEANDDASSIFIEALGKDDGIELITTPSGSEVGFDRESVRQGIVDHNFNFALIIPGDYLKEDGIGLKLEFLSNPKNEIESQIMNGLIQKAVFTNLPQLLAGQLDEWNRQEMGDENYEAFMDGLAALLSLSFDEFEYDEIRPQMGLQGLRDFLNSESETAKVAGDSEEEPSAIDGFFEDLVQIKEDQVFGKEVKNPYLTRMIGGYAIMFLLFATTGSAASLFEERNEGIFLRLLSMPVSRVHILWSKFLFNTLLGITQACVLFIASSFLFDIEVFSNMVTLLVVSVFASAACTAFGMLLASISKTTQQAQGFGTLLIISMSALGGAWFPLSMMPAAMQVIGKFTIVYWGVEAYLGALWEGGDVIALLPYIGMLTAITVGLMGIATWRFRKGNLFS